MTKKLSKKEARLQRKIEKLAKQKDKQVRLSSSIKINDKYIRVTQIPNLIKKPRSQSPENYKAHYFSWCCSQSDREGEWTWKNNEPRSWTDDEFTSDIESRLNSYNNNSWMEVESFTYNGASGFRKQLNKYQSLDTICNEAQERWLSLDTINQFDELFRFRLGTHKRIWGIRIQHHFFLVWYERHHQIYPLS